MKHISKKLGGFKKPEYPSPMLLIQGLNIEPATSTLRTTGTTVNPKPCVFASAAAPTAPEIQAADDCEWANKSILIEE
jgi:hypothetical protein